jgi:hypothetical protein
LRAAIARRQTNLQSNVMPFDCRLVLKLHVQTSKKFLARAVTKEVYYSVLDRQTNILFLKRNGGVDASFAGSCGGAPIAIIAVQHFVVELL